MAGPPPISSPAPLVAVHRSPAPRPRRPGEVLDQLLGRPDAARLVRQMPPQELYYTLREIGLADAQELLRLCSPEQVQAFLDIDCWQQDHLDPDRTQSWLEALTELGPERLGYVVERLDHEFLVTFLHHRIRVHELSDEESPPEEPEGHFYETPDRFYLIDVLPEGASGAAIDRLLESLYMADLDLGRRVVMGARWDMGAETEEMAYRFRSGRMADLGYVDYYEALKVYVYLDPHSVHLNENTAPPLGSLDEPATLNLCPSEIADVLREPTVLGRALLGLPGPQREALVRRLLLLVNQVLSADRADPGDLQAARPVIARAAAYLSLALEYLSRDPQTPGPQRADVVVTGPGDAGLSPGTGTDEHALTALRTVSLVRLFRLGYSLTLQLSRLSGLLVERGLTTLLGKHDPASLLPLPHAQVLRLLLSPDRRPLYTRLLDPLALQQTRPFATLADIARTALILEEATSLGRFLTLGLGLRQDNLPAILADKRPALADIRMHHLLGTMIANLLLRRPPALVPLSRQDLPALRQAALGLGGNAAAGLTQAARGLITTSLRERVKERSLSEKEAQSLWPPAVERFVAQTLDGLGRSLGALPADLGPEEADAVVSLDGLVLS